MKEKNKVSIIIPVYNCENYIRKCLDSIINQTYQNFEIICIDDGSVDASAEIIQEEVLNNGKVKYYFQANSGQGVARNNGIEHATGEFVTFIDSDDYIQCDYIETLIEPFKNDNQLVMSCCYLNRIFEYKANLLERTFSYQKNVGQSSTFNIKDNPDSILEIINSPCCKVIKTEFLNQHEIRFPLNMIYEDAVFTHHILSLNPKVALSSYNGYNYVLRKGSTMTSNKSIEDMFLAAKMIYSRYHNALLDTVYDQLDYYVFHHVCIGLVYRQFKINCFKTLSMINKTKLFLNENQINMNYNETIKKQSIIVREFALIYKNKGLKK